MAILLTIMLLTLGLAWRAGVAQHRLRPIEPLVNDDYGVLDACARASVLVFVSLLGLLALGVMYGNVLGMNPTP
jgi:hypothetical protein